jgi:phosphatidate cytidylyltransferase
MLRQRLQSGFLLGGTLLAALIFMPKVWLLPLLLILVFVSLVEFYALLDASRIPHFKVVGLICGLGLVAGNWFALLGQQPWRQEAESFIFFLTTAFVFIRQISCRHTDRPWDTMAGTLLGVIYVAFLFNFLLKLVLGWGPTVDGRRLLLYLIAVVKCTDIGAYSVGCAIGRHKFIPRISPKKTWEGVVGGVLCGLAASLLFVFLAHGSIGPIHVSWVDAVILGLVLSAAGVTGDLIESLLKRAAGVKDSGTFILGMGGILDVVDSLLFAAPLLYMYVRLFIV